MQVDVWLARQGSLGQVCHCCPNGQDVYVSGKANTDVLKDADIYLLIPLPVTAFRRFCHLRFLVTLLCCFAITADAYVVSVAEAI
jgi:hypothetical protein